MPDREKVIKGLEVCLKNIDQQDCPNDCPYLSDCSKYENRVVFQPLMRDALALLKEQEDSCWINVKDKLPPRNANVLWWCILRDRGMGHVRIGFYEGITNHDIPEVSCCAPNCIPLYWMPMPNAPTEAAIDASGNCCCADGERRS